MGDLIASEATDVGQCAVLPFAVDGMDDHGQLQTQQMLPLSSTGRFRSGMMWVHTTMAHFGYGRAPCSEGKIRACSQCVAWTPVVRDIVAAANAQMPRRRCDVPLHTFVEVEVRGNNMIVGKLHPIYLQWSVGMSTGLSSS